MNKNYIYISIFIFILLIGNVHALTPLEDSSINKINLTNNNAIYNTLGWYDYLAVDNQSYINSTNDIKLSPINTNNSYTLNIWFKSLGYSPTRTYILSKGSSGNFEYQITIETDKSVVLTIYNLNGSTNKAVTLIGGAGVILNQWYYLTMNLNTTDIRTYVDGNLINSQVIGGVLNGVPSSPVKLLLGKRGDSAKTLNGSIDDVTIFNTPLAQGVVKSLMLERENNFTVLNIYYHSISDGNISPSITVANFTEQMETLYNNSGVSILPRQIINNSFTIPNHAFIFGFDDGRSDNYYTVKNITDAYNFSGYLSIVTDFADTNKSGYLGWSEINLMSNAGWEIASHGTNHTSFLTLSSLQRHQQFLESKNRIILNTGVTPTLFIYPYNAHNSTTDSECRQYYLICSGDNANAQFLSRSFNFTNYGFNRSEVYANGTTSLDLGNWINPEKYLVVDYSFTNDWVNGTQISYLNDSMLFNKVNITVVHNSSINILTYKNINVSLINLLTWSPYNDIKNTSNNVILYSNINNQSLILSPNQQIEVGNFVHSGNCYYTYANLSIPYYDENPICIYPLSTVVLNFTGFSSTSKNDLKNSSNDYIIVSSMNNDLVTLYSGWNILTGDFRDLILTTPPIDENIRAQCHSTMANVILSFLEIPNWFIIIFAIIAASIIIGIMVAFESQGLDFTSGLFTIPLVAILLSAFIFVIGIIIISSVC